ncbi:hypothetical protein ATANTOWER_032729 [Ataeniobius toweri]|uniref:Uncharacterized protein n=1 Tax=Ataeniobius toweri TaxID=208326 RepID=A0ABU7A3E1_9TELE|nr:hypothetical protein [Ataeniobius toweri]
MDSNQQQTDQLQETSPRHVYGNQLFSRDWLIAAKGEGGRRQKTIEFSLFSAKKISRLSAPYQTEYDLMTCCQTARRNITDVEILIAFETTPQDLFWGKSN